MNILICNLEFADEQQLEALKEELLDTYSPVCKAVRTPAGQPIDEAFEEEFLNTLARRTRTHFLSARRHIWHTVENYLRAHGGTFSNLTPEQLIELERTMFELGLAHTSHMVGIAVDPAVERRLRRWGWTPREILDFPGLAYRFALIRALIESGRLRSFEELLVAAQAHPLSEAERQAIQIARTTALNQLRPVYDRAGRLITGEALNRERDLLRDLVAQAIAKRLNPLVVAREMYHAEAAQGIFRDFERIARTEIANAFSQGAFRADRASGKFQPDDLVYRITRPTACKICLALYTNEDGTPRLYRVRDLERGTAPEIDIGVRTERFYRAVIGATHPNEMCSDWQKYYPAMQLMFEQVSEQYRQGRENMGLEVDEAA